MGIVGGGVYIIGTCLGRCAQRKSARLSQRRRRDGEHRTRRGVARRHRRRVGAGGVDWKNHQERREEEQRNEYSFCNDSWLHVPGFSLLELVCAYRRRIRSDLAAEVGGGSAGRRATGSALRGAAVHGNAPGFEMIVAACGSRVVHEGICRVLGLLVLYRRIRGGSGSERVVSEYDVVRVQRWMARTRTLVTAKADVERVGQII